MQCKALTKKGQACRLKASHGDYCHRHKATVAADDSSQPLIGATTRRTTPATRAAAQQAESAARQQHGLNYEQRIIAEYGLTAATSYTDPWDAKWGDIPVQIKYGKQTKGSIELGDYFRHRNMSEEGFILILGEWTNKQKDKEVDRHCWYINGAEWRELFACPDEFAQAIEDKLEEIKNTYEDDPKWEEMKRFFKQGWGDKRPASLRPKRDHKEINGQKRMQCALKLSHIERMKHTVVLDQHPISEWQRLIDEHVPRELASQVASEHMDKFYTKPEIVKLCCERLDFSRYKLIVEPAAGDGAFLKQLPATAKVLAYDLNPEAVNIVRQDFFTVTLPYKRDEAVLTLGNPPFGRNCSLALKFIKHAASYSDTIAFILPRSFKKDSVQNKVPLAFGLVESFDLPKRSFLLAGEPYDVPCVFQVWQRLSEPRVKVEPCTSTDLFQFVKMKEDWQVSVRRVGVNAGTAAVRCDGALPEPSYYFIALPADGGLSVAEFVKRCNEYKWVGGNTTGAKSITKGELIAVVAEQC